MYLAYPCRNALSLSLRIGSNARYFNNFGRLVMRGKKRHGMGLRQRYLELVVGNTTAPTSAPGEGRPRVRRDASGRCRNRFCDPKQSKRFDRSQKLFGFVELTPRPSKIEALEKKSR